MPSRYDEETKTKAIRLLGDHAGDYDSPWAAMCAISGRLGMTAETLRKWVRQAEVDDGQAAGVPAPRSSSSPKTCTSRSSARQPANSCAS